MNLEVIQMRKEVEKAIESIRPTLRADGGDIELVDIKEDMVMIRLKGACSGCPMAQMTLKGFIEDVIKKKVPGVKGVEAV
jgi:Fe-S cluster biogenesis protein NfuA